MCVMVTYFRNDLIRFFPYEQEKNRKRDWSISFCQHHQVHTSTHSFTQSHCHHNIFSAFSFSHTKQLNLNNYNMPNNKENTLVVWMKMVSRQRKTRKNLFFFSQLKLGQGHITDVGWLWLWEQKIKNRKTM